MELYDKNNQEIFVGSRVLWHDPEESAKDLSRVYDVEDIIGEDEDAVILITDEFGEAEVFANELEVIQYDNLENDIPNEFDPIWDEYVGMPYESLPWFMKNEEDQ